jgi:hypothetical protein
MNRIALLLAAAALLSSGCGDGTDSGQIGVTPSNNGADAGDAGSDGDGGGDTGDTGPMDPRCEGLDDPTTLTEGEPTECGDFASPCAQKGVQMRTDEVCQGGQVVEVELEVTCERVTEGVVVEEDEFGACDGFDDACDTSGTQTRPVTVCRMGEPNEEVEEAECARDTDGVVVDEGLVGECGGFADTCAEDGTAPRNDRVCREGAAVEEEAQVPCERDTEGVELERVPDGECGGFDDSCDTTGEVAVLIAICRDGATAQESGTDACERDTEGVVAAVGEFGDCGGFGSECDESGEWTRTDTVCQGGQGVPADVTEDCSRDTDGVVVEVGELGECGGFVDTCDETGSATRTNQVCADGQQGPAEVTEDCARDTDGFVVETGTFGECGDFDDACDESGTQLRTDVVCDDGAESDLEVAGDCARDTEGDVLEEVVGDCGDFADACAEDGTLSVTSGICRDGQAETETRTEDCTRDTDGTIVDVGEFGECGAFEDTCDETGTQVRTDTVCEDGVGVAQEVEGDCARDTEGLVVSMGEEGDCGGFDGACDESGTAVRPDRVCRGGQEVEEEIQVDCTRDTNGVVVDDGVLGECERFDDTCDETGVQVRVEVLCADGAETDVEHTTDCTRETDGEVVEVGEPGECGEFGSECDETGFTERTDVVCEDGESVDVVRLAVDCTRNTDGIVVDEGEFGPCGGFESQCSRDGTQARGATVCRNGGAIVETQTQACQRETEGQVVSFGEWGACVQFEDDCDETGIRRRNNIVCAGAEPVHVLDEEDCVRVAEDCGDLCIPDGEEPNDMQGDAAPTLAEIGGVEIYELTLCQGDEDWYSFIVPQGGSAAQIRLRQTPDVLVLPIELIGPDDQTIAINSDPGGERFLTAEGLALGTHYIRIVAAPGPAGVDYDLSVAIYDEDGCPPDYHEPNDDFDAPAFLSRGRTESALCGGELDHFSFFADPFSSFDITMRFEHNGGDDPFTYLYSPDGDLHDFFNPDGNDPDLEVLGQGRVNVSPSLAGEWTVLVDGAFTARDFPYEFNLSYQAPMCPEAPDAFEPNGTCASGTRLPLDLENCEPGTPNCQCRQDQTCDAPTACVRGVCQTGHVCGPVGDEDYYLVEVAADQELRVRVEHFHFQGNLELEVYEPDWSTLGAFSYQAGPDFEEATITPTASGPYCIRVFARGGITANSYHIETFVTDD